MIKKVKTTVPLTYVINDLSALHEKPYLFSPNVLERLSFQKKLHWNTIFLVSSGKMIFLFLENILLFRRKLKDDLSQKKPKKHGNMIYSSNVPKRWSFQKNTALEYDLSYIRRKYGISFSRKYDIFSTDGK